MPETVRSMWIVNVMAEHGLALMAEYTLLHNNDEEQMQFLVRTVKNNRQQYTDRNKLTLMQ